jgi:hypothetical protein
MRTSIKQEFAAHLLSLINDGVIDDTNKDDWHFHAFNEDYYIIGYFEAKQWLAEHDYDPFEAIGICQEYEIDNFGESQVYDNIEKTANMLAYILGEEFIYSLDAENIEELTEELNNL